MCRCERALTAVEGARTGLHLHIPAYACVSVFVWIGVLVVPCIPAAGNTWLCCHHSGSCCEVSLQAGREGRPSLWLTQAERGFLHIFCHTIWALVSVAAPLRTHLAARGADGHLLFATSWWNRENNNQQSLLAHSLHTSLHTVTQCLFGWRQCLDASIYLL